LLKKIDNKDPCIKTLRGMPRGMFFENQLMLAHDMLKNEKVRKTKKGTSWFLDDYVMILLIKFF
jgi:hypothetical protein